MCTKVIKGKKKTKQKTKTDKSPPPLHHGTPSRVAFSVYNHLARHVIFNGLFFHIQLLRSHCRKLHLVALTFTDNGSFHNIQTNMDLLWNERFWFPEGVTWEDLRNIDPNVYIPQIEDIGLLSIFIGFVLLIIRFLSERELFRISSKPDFNILLGIF